MQLDAFQRGKFQPKLRRPLVLLYQLILREDARALDQLFQRKRGGKLLNFTGFLFGQIENRGYVCPGLREQQRTPELDYLRVELAQIRTRLREFVDRPRPASPAPGPVRPHRLSTRWPGPAGSRRRACPQRRFWRSAQPRLAPVRSSPLSLRRAGDQ